MSAPAAAVLALRGDLLDFACAPALGDRDESVLRWRPDHWLLIDAAGRIAAVQQEAPPEGCRRIDHRGRLVLPGFIDTHVHSAQLPVIGSWGSQLLDWLNDHTFPAEAAQADPMVARATAAQFLDALLAAGTTSAVVFPTVHRGSCEALFEAAEARGMRLIAGKVLMDRHAPAYLCDDVDGARADCEALIARWHGRSRLAYAVTPRFAPTSSDAQLRMAGELLAQAPGLYLQTHVAENRDEVRWVAELFPAARSYLDVYERFGLLNRRAVLAHGIWLDDADRTLLAERGAQVAASPSSNLFLGSGLFDWRAADRAGVTVSLASDVGGGTALSMLRTMADAYRVQAMAGTRVTAWDLLHACTRGAAQALGLSHEIGSLEPGAMADLAVWDWAADAVQAQRQQAAKTLHEKCFAWVMMSDDRNRVQSLVAGRPVTAAAAQAGTAAQEGAHAQT